MRYFAVLVALLCAAPTAHAAVFLQCASLLLTTDLIQGLINVVTTAFSEAATQSGCASHCSKQGATYSIYQPGLLGLLATCYCSSTSPQAGYVIGGSDSGGNCFPATYNIQYLPSQQWKINSCTKGSSVAGGPAAFNTRDDASCFTQCAAYKHLMMSPQSDGSYKCQCGTTLTKGGSATCSSSPVQQLYINDSPTASGVARRSKIARELERRNAARTLCPAPQTACVIPGTDSFECLDTESELEACGGCRFRVFESDAAPHARFPVGVDCTAIPGVAVGGVSCRAGQCVVSACTRSFSFQDGTCVPLDA